MLSTMKKATGDQSLKDLFTFMSKSNVCIRYMLQSVRHEISSYMFVLQVGGPEILEIIADHCIIFLSLLKTWCSPVGFFNLSAHVFLLSFFLNCHYYFFY